MLPQTKVNYVNFIINSNIISDSFTDVIDNDFCISIYNPFEDIVLCCDTSRFEVDVWCAGVLLATCYNFIDLDNALN